MGQLKAQISQLEAQMSYLGSNEPTWGSNEPTLGSNELTRDPMGITWGSNELTWDWKWLTWGSYQQIGYLWDTWANLRLKCSNLRLKWVDLVDERDWHGHKMGLLEALIGKREAQWVNLRLKWVNLRLKLETWGSNWQTWDRQTHSNINLKIAHISINLGWCSLQLAHSASK